MLARSIRKISSDEHPSNDGSSFKFLASDKTLSSGGGEVEHNHPNYLIEYAFGAFMYSVGRYLQFSQSRHVLECIVFDVAQWIASQFQCNQTFWQIVLGNYIDFIPR